MTRKPNIAFVALNSYNVLSQRSDICHVGGAEMQQVFIAKWLRKQGFHIDFVTLDHGQPDGIVHDDITSYKAYALDRGLPIMRFIHPRTTGFWAAMKRTSADIFYQRGASLETGLVALWCHRQKRPFIFSVANDMDCLPTLPALRKWRERWLYRWGLQQATAVVAQTEYQQHLLQSNFGLQSTIVRSTRPAPQDPATPLPRVMPTGKRHRILWAGRLSWEKRCDWLLDIATACPEMDFDVACHVNPTSNWQQQWVRQAAATPNIHLHGYLPPHRMHELYREVTLLCNTSSYEGFPNTFLEAWSHGIPVVATFDPDGIIEKQGIGWTANTVEGLSAVLKHAVASPAELKQASIAAHTYFLAHHVPDACLPALSQVITEAAQANL